MGTQNDTVSWEDAKNAKKEVSIVLKTYNNDPCPCRSGKKYKKCCRAENGKNRRYKYTFKKK